jgi:hypothetical protein
MDELTGRGFSVRAETAPPQGLRFGREITMTEAVSC